MSELTYKNIGRYEIRFLGTFPHLSGLTLTEIKLKEGDRLVVLKMTGPLEAVVMIDDEVSLCKLASEMKDPGKLLGRKMRADRELREIVEEFLKEQRSNYQNENDTASDPKEMFRNQGKIAAIDDIRNSLDEFMSLKEQDPLDEDA